MGLVMPVKDTKLLTRLTYHAWRRGMKEMDLILGGYANLNLPNFSEESLIIFEAILARDDQELLPIFTLSEEPDDGDPHYKMLMEIRQFVSAGGAVTDTSLSEE